MLLILLLFVAAVALVYVELFLPGGVFGAMGIAALIGSVVLAFVKYQEMGFLISAVELIAGAILILIGLKTFPTSHAGKLLILGRNLDKKLGYSGTESLEMYRGKEGVSLTHLRPAGIARIGNKRVDVVSDGAFIEKGRQLRVVDVEGNRVVVREVEAKVKA